MIEWVLIILFQPMWTASETSLAVPGFSDEKTCHDAVNFVEATYKTAKAVCVQSKK